MITLTAPRFVEPASCATLVGPGTEDPWHSPSLADWRDAANVCRRCPALAECRDYAEGWRTDPAILDKPHGILAGLRYDGTGKPGQRVRPVQHGAHAYDHGYCRCDDCSDAHLARKARQRGVA